LTDEGCRTLRKHYAQAAACFYGKPFQRAVTFEQAYLSDLLQAMVDAGETVYCQPIEGYWREIDTVEDLRNVETEFVGRVLSAP
jgi:NDP-sugar pyrophosphorylase family protein